MADSDHISGLGRVVIGGLGGFAAVLSKYLGQDHSYYLRMLDLGHQAKIDNLWIGYYAMTPALIFLGALVAWASDEHHRFKLLAIAVAAPALITTWAGGATAGSKFAFDFVSPAYAQAAETAVAKPGLGEGIKIWFGIGRDEQKYRVVIGSFKNEEAAIARAAQINKLDPTLKASVGDKKMFNDFYPVVVGGYAPYPAARALKEKVSEKLDTDDVYLSPYSW